MRGACTLPSGPPSCGGTWPGGQQRPPCTAAQLGFAEWVLRRCVWVEDQPAAGISLWPRHAPPPARAAVSTHQVHTHQAGSCAPAPTAHRQDGRHRCCAGGTSGPAIQRAGAFHAPALSAGSAHGRTWYKTPPRLKVTGTRHHPVAAGGRGGGFELVDAPLPGKRESKPELQRTQARRSLQEGGCPHEPAWMLLRGCWATES